ncbi:MAG: hypothetical protein K6E92_09515 [Lachnospiraceae bacterium]|nr:hypothetical protein [Lachnospiraceae bacterium]
MKKKSYIMLAAGLLFLTVAVSTVAYVIFGADSEQIRKERILIAEAVEHAVEDHVMEPVTVARMMCEDANFKSLLQREEEISESEAIEEMRRNLFAIQRRFGYPSVYLISEATHRYYSFVGLNKIIDPQTDTFDTWYSIFVDGGKEFELESSTDEVNRDRLTIFVDGRVEDESGKLLGVAGVGLELESLQKLLGKYEKEYDIRIDYINAEGLIQIESNGAAIQNNYISGVDLEHANSEDFLYTGNGLGGFTIVKYDKMMNWYLVIRNRGQFEGFGYDFRFFFLEAAMLIIGVAALVAGARNLRVQSIVGGRDDGEVDALTGLPNRSYFTRVYGEKGTLNTTQYQTIAQFGIDDYEDLSHMPGFDRTVLSVVRSAREIFGQSADLIRWNNSAFVVLLELPIGDAYDDCKAFCKLVSETGRATVSVGVTKIDLDATLMSNYYRAVQCYYMVRELGGNNVRKG